MAWAPDRIEKPHPADRMGQLGIDQYSLASMTVMTRQVTAGSAGSGEPIVRVRS